MQVVSDIKNTTDKNCAMVQIPEQAKRHGLYHQKQTKVSDKLKLKIVTEMLNDLWMSPH